MRWTVCRGSKVWPNATVLRTVVLRDSGVQILSSASVVLQRPLSTQMMFDGIAGELSQGRFQLGDSYPENFQNQSLTVSFSPSIFTLPLLDNLIFVPSVVSIVTESFQSISSLPLILDIEQSHSPSW